MVMTGTPHCETMAVVRAFNTAGPVRADRDYQIAPLSRIDLEEVLGLIRDEKYFSLHAPRQTGKTSALLALLARWCMADPRPLVLLIDEIDALVGDTLLSVLRQLRTGYVDRPQRFPHSIVLCGLRDVRDYRIHSSAENRLVLGGSAFNIKSESLRLGDFGEPETRTLTAQHTEQTGQAFTEDALQLIWERTAGQPWLVNALCYDACFRHKPGRDRARPITAAAILEAQERLILRRDTHIDDLANKLREERVRRVIEPILAGADRPDVVVRGRRVCP